MKKLRKSVTPLTIAVMLAASYFLSPVRGGTRSLQSVSIDMDAVEVGVDNLLNFTDSMAERYIIFTEKIVSALEKI